MSDSYFVPSVGIKTISITNNRKDVESEISKDDETIQDEAKEVKACQSIDGGLEAEDRWASAIEIGDDSLNPFERRPTIGRSPPEVRRSDPQLSTSATKFTSTPKSNAEGKQRKTSLPDLNTMLRNQIDEIAKSQTDLSLNEKSNKRLRDDTSPGETSKGQKKNKLSQQGRISTPLIKSVFGRGSAYNPEKLLDDLMRQVEGLHTIVESNPNTKLDIKKCAERMLRISNDIKFARRTHSAEIPKSTASTETQTTPEYNTVSTQTIQTCTSVNTQTIENPEESSTKIIEETLKATDKSDENFNRISNLTWAEEHFRVTKLINGNPMTHIGDSDLVMLTISGQETSSGVLRQLKKWIPETSELLETHERPAGDIQYIRTQTYRGENETLRSSLKFYYSVTTSNVADKGDAIGHTLSWMLKLKELLFKHGRRKLTIISPLGSNYPLYRQLLEFMFHEEDFELYLFHSTHKRDGKIKSDENPSKTRRNPNEEAIVVRTGSKSYADLLKEVKRTEKSSSLLPIKMVRKTKAGDALFVIDNTEKNNAEIFKDTVLNKLEGISVRQSGDKRLLQIVGLDAAASKNDIELAFEAIKEQGDNFEIKNLRPSRNDTQNATIEASRRLSDKLILEGKIRIGFNKCRIFQRVEVQRCYRCLVLGHTSTSCKNPSRENDCLKCGMEGHKAKDCTGEEFCFNCSKNGHRSNSTGCPIFKDLLNKIRAQEHHKIAREDCLLEQKVKSNN